MARTYSSLPFPLTFVLLAFSGWVNRQQHAVIDYLLNKNGIRSAVNESRRLRLTSDQRRRLAVKGKIVVPRHLAAVAGIATPDTLVRWYRTLVVQKYGGLKTRWPARPNTAPDILPLLVRLVKENSPQGRTAFAAGSSISATTSRATR